MSCPFNFGPSPNLWLTTWQKHRLVLCIHVGGASSCHTHEWFIQYDSLWNFKHEWWLPCMRRNIHSDVSENISSWEHLFEPYQTESRGTRLAVLFYINVIYSTVSTSALLLIYLYRTVLYYFSLMLLSFLTKVKFSINLPRVSPWSFTIMLHRMKSLKVILISQNKNAIPARSYMKHHLLSAVQALSKH